MTRSILLATFVSLGTTHLAALTVTVTATGTKESPARIGATVRRVDSNVPSTREVEFVVGAPTSVELSEGTWEITTTSAAFWSAPVYASASDTVTLRLWPRASISGSLGNRTPSSGELVVSFAPTQPLSEQPGPEGVIPCPFAGRDWICSLPAGELDLRINLTGFATEFRWGVKVAGDTPVTLSRLDFAPGSSVYGKVQFADKAKPAVLRTAEVSARPLNVGDTHTNAQRHTATPDARGFFQIRGLPPGEFVLQAHTKELYSETRTVRIIAQTNASLKEPLVLAEPRRLSVRVTPPLDPQQQLWQVALLKKQLGGKHFDTIGRSLASTTGEWSHQRVLPGDYLLIVGQTGGGEWSSQEMAFAPTDADRSIDILLTTHRVAGRVTLGERPIQAKVGFGGENGATLLADEQGRFEGTVPSLKHDEITLLVTSKTPDVRRTLVVEGKRSSDGVLYFDIVLPATTILGRTMDENGSPISAVVTIRSKDEGVFEQMFTAEDGAFQFAGFEPGVYVLQAEDFQKASAVVDVDVGTETIGIDLVVRPLEEVRGRIFMRGVPVAGADIYAFPRGVKSSFMPEGTSDTAGRFVLSLPPGTRTYDVVVIPRGFYVTAGRITKDPKQPDLRVEVGQNGGSLTVDAPDDAVRLRLVHAGGEYELTFLAAATHSPVTKTNGRQQFTIPNLEPGTYSVCTTQKCTSVYVPSFATASVTLND